MPKFNNDLRSRLKRRFSALFKKKDSDIKSSLDSNTKRNRSFKFILLGGITSFILLVVFIHERQPKAVKEAPKEVKTTVDISLEKQWMGKAQQEVDVLSQSQRQFKKATDDQLIQLSRTLKQLDSRMAQLNEKIADIDRNKSDLTSHQQEGKHGKTSSQDERKSSYKNNENNKNHSQTDINNPNINDAYDRFNQDSTQNNTQDTGEVANPDIDQFMQNSSPQSNAMIGYEAPVDKKKSPEVVYKSNPNAGSLPLGSWAKVSLLNGGDFPAGVSAQGQPKPVFVNLLSDFVMPNGYRYNLKGCTGMGAGFGGYSEKRVYIKIHQISCVGKKGVTMVSDNLVAQVMDSDAKVGLKGELYENTAYKSMLATISGIFSGVASVAASSQGTSYSGAQGAYSVLSGGAAVNSSIGNAAASGLGQLSKFFIDKLNSMQPYITVNTGRISTIVISQTKALHWVNRQDAKVKMNAPVEVAKAQDIEVKANIAPKAETSNHSMSHGLGNIEGIKNIQDAPDSVSKAVENALDKGAQLTGEFSKGL
jgi:conjugal transfer pilus assembly protein TraB